MDMSVGSICNPNRVFNNLPVHLTFDGQLNDNESIKDRPLISTRSLFHRKHLTRNSKIRLHPCYRCLLPRKIVICNRNRPPHIKYRPFTWQIMHSKILIPTKKKRYFRKQLSSAETSITRR